MDTIAPVSPGEVLTEEYLEPLGIGQYALAKAIHVDPMRINRIVNGKQAVSADTALRLGRYFGTTAQFWLNLQDHHDLVTAEQSLDLDSIEPFAGV